MIIIIICFLSFTRSWAVFRLHFKSGNFLHMYESPRFFFPCCIPRLLFLRQQRKRGEYRNDGKPRGVPASASPNMLFLRTVIFTVESMRIYGAQITESDCCHAIPYHGIIPYRRIIHYQRTNIFVRRPHMTLDASSAQYVSFLLVPIV